MGNAVNDISSPDASASGYGRTPLRGGHALQACQNSGSARQALFFTLALQKECRPGGAFVRSPMRKRRDSKTPKIQTKKSLTALPFGVNMAHMLGELNGPTLSLGDPLGHCDPKGVTDNSQGFQPLVSCSDIFYSRLAGLGFFLGLSSSSSSRGIASSSSGFSSRSRGSFL